MMTPLADQRGTCPHLSAVLAENRSLLANIHVYPRYSAAIKRGAAWVNPPAITGTPDLELPPEPSCVDCGYFRRLAVCLHCATVACSNHGHLAHHLGTAGHMFAWDIEYGAVYCAGCRDYVYDDRFVPQQLPLTKNDAALLKTFSSSPPLCGGLRGLKNMGATCYLNVVLQSLIHNPYIRDYFLRDMHSAPACGAETCIACEFDGIVSHVFSGDTVPHVPHTFLRALWTARREIAASGQHDSHECFISVMNALHTALAGEDKPGRGGASANRACPCPIHSTFGGTLHSRLTCPSCGHVAAAEDPFLDISLDLKGTEAHAVINTWTPRASATANAYSSSSPQLATLGGPGATKVTLAQCLSKFTAVEQVQYTCGQCKTDVLGRKQMTIAGLPNSLCLQLKRFEVTATSSTKIETPVSVPFVLAMGSYLTERQHRSSPTAMYTLYSVIHHKGQLNTGHYTVYIYNRGHWFRIDDDKVTRVDEDEAAGTNAYMCFYSKRPTAEMPLYPNGTSSVK
ncbi:hypothetical protein H9P43_004279 [Blastocladiella emersonii ATCC 22665]|nr:hypothetical protein H9P43_004279 [Blastocladiella emersonii ATCC 22665]